MFWPAFLLCVGGARSAAEAFDVDQADLDVRVTDLFDHDRWPVFEVDVTKGHRVHVVLCNLDGEGSVDYLLSPADGSAPVFLPQEVAAELLGNEHYWRPCRWRITDGVRWCSGTHTYRNQENPDLRLFTEAFG